MQRVLQARNIVRPQHAGNDGFVKLLRLLSDNKQLGFRKLLRLLSGTNETIGSGNCLDCLVELMRLSLICCGGECYSKETCCGSV